MAGERSKIKPNKTLRIGLTGGIGSGKSTVAKTFQQSKIPVVDLDEHARALREHSPQIRKQILRALGKGCLTQGKLDARKIREIVFKSPKKRKALQNILHPKLLSLFEKEAKKAEKENRPFIICEAALLIEGGYYKKLDKIILVTAPLTKRIKFLKKRDSMNPTLTRAIMKAQWPDKKKKQKADFVLTNNTSLKQLARKTKALTQLLKS